LEKYKRENPDATDTDIDIKSIIKLYKNARTSRGAHAPAPGVRILAQHIPIPQHGLAAGHVQQALLHVQEMRAQLAVAERDARMAAAQVRPDLLLDPTGYAINFEGLFLFVAIYFTGIPMYHITHSRLGQSTGTRDSAGSVHPSRYALPKTGFPI